MAIKQHKPTVAVSGKTLAAKAAPMPSATGTSMPSRRAARTRFAPAKNGAVA